MRSSLSHPTTERRRHERRASWRHRNVDGPEQAAPSTTAAALSQQRTAAANPADPRVEVGAGQADPADTACYSCECGLVFSAVVSTTVKCPNCGTQQAW
jgi:hypothetical protein